MFYVNEDIPSRILNAEDYLKCFEVILLEFSLRNKNSLCFGLHKPPGQNEVLAFNPSMHYFENGQTYFKNLVVFTPQNI